jgi:hypothetical protein
MNMAIAGAAMTAKSLAHRAVVLLAALALGGCLDEGEQTEFTDAPASIDQPAPPAPSPPTSNQPPEIHGTPPLSIEVGQSYDFTPTANDGDNDFLEFSVVNLPSWARFSDVTGALTGAPAEGDVGETAEITITVTDGRDTRSIGPFKVRVNPRPTRPSTNTPPAISGSPPTSVLVGQTYSFQPAAQDVDGDRLSYSISNRPSWASFSTSTGRLSGVPSNGNIANYSNIVISVSDGRATVSLPAFTLQVRGPDNTPPSITGSPATSV